MKNKKGIDRKSAYRKGSSVNSTNILFYRNNSGDLYQGGESRLYEEFAEDETSIYEYDLRCLSYYNRRRKR